MAEDTRYRSDYPRDEQGADPLTELARLIGQSDPFADKARRASAHLDTQEQRQAPGWLARSSEPGYDQHGFADDPNAPQPYAAYRAPADDSNYDAGHESYDQYPPQGSAYDDRYAQGHQDHADARHAVQGYAAEGDEHAGDDRYRVAPPAADHQSDDYYEDGYDDGHLPPRSEEEGVLASAGRRGGLVTIAAVLGLALVGTAGAFGYRAFTGPSADSVPPVIKADPNPAKLTPAAPSADAADKPFQDRVGTVQTERIVPREETPVAQPVPPSASLPTAPPWPTPAAPRAGAAPPAAAVPGANPDARRVRTETIRVAPNGDPTGTTRPPAPVPNAPRAAKQNSPMTIAPSADAAPPPARVQTARVSPAATDGAYVVQVSAQKTESDAQSSYRALQQKYPGVLGGREATIRRADLGDKGIYFRAQIGGFASAAEATNFCDSLKASGGQCIVQKN
jgi:hypothetical protein